MLVAVDERNDAYYMQYNYSLGFWVCIWVILNASQHTK